MKSTNSITHIRYRRLLRRLCHLIRAHFVHTIITVSDIRQCEVITRHRPFNLYIIVQPRCSSCPITTIVVQRACIISVVIVINHILRPISILMDIDNGCLPLNKGFIAQIVTSANSSVHCRAFSTLFSLASRSTTGLLYFGSAKKTCILLSS